MMSGHGANPVFFNEKKIKIERPELSLTPNVPTSDNISFLPIEVATLNLPRMFRM